MRKQMKKVLIMLAAVAVMFTMMPDTAEAASKKTITVTASGAKISSSKLSITATGTSQLTVKYAGKKVTTKATYKSSNTKVATVSKKITVTVNAAGSTSTGATTHQHTWKAHTATTKQWVPDIQEKTVAAIKCCGCGELIPIDPDSPELMDAHREHMMNHMLRGEPGGGLTVYTTIEVDCGHYVEPGEVDYYYCDCGARKTP